MNLSTQAKSFHILNLSTIAAFLTANGDRDGEVYNLLTEAIGEGFTWGDTDHTLVHIGSFLEYFPAKVVFGSPIHKLLAALDTMIDGCRSEDLFYIDLEN